jgi:predicted nucleic acid-binding protein
MEIILKEKYLVDTNILIYSLDKKSPFYTASCNLLRDGLQKGARFIIAQQNLVELIAVLTKAYKISPNEALADAGSFAFNFEIITPLPTTLETFERLLKQSKGQQQIFDIYLAATMRDNDVCRIITANKKDFLGLGMEEIVEVK